MKKLATVVAAIAAFGFVSAVSAADMPVKAVKAPVAAPAYNWTGFYVGGLVGYGWGKSQHCDPDAGCVPGQPEPNPNGWNAGVTLGYNWQWTQWVLGIEGDWSWAHIYGSSPSIGGFGCLGTCDTRIKSFETLRGRFGYAFDRFLPYVTAGVAWTQLWAGFGSSALANSTSSATKTSFTVGGGLEYAFWQNWSAKVEYLYIAKLGDLTFGQGICNPPGCFARTDAINEVRFGLNYRFSGL